MKQTSDYMKSNTIDHGKPRKVRFLIGLAFGFGLLLISFPKFYDVAMPNVLDTSDPLAVLKVLKKEAASSSIHSSSDSLEKFQVYYPNVIKESYGESLTEQVLVNHTFSNSWGNPAVVDYQPPKVEFNKIVVTLDTKVDGVQFDRLAHLFIDGVQVWRTSTIEPGGLESHSTFTKDISDYSPLFKSKAKVVFQLDNVVNTIYTGEFRINITVNYYFDKEFDSIKRSYGDVADLLKSKGEATKILPLGKGANNILSPLSYFPDDSLRFKLPNLNKNTSNVQLSIFTSGNGDEEFWYANSVDDLVDQQEFHEMKTLGHGPVRHVEVYINGELLFTQAADPYIFTGGMSPALWSPVVAYQAFDLKSIDFDLTPILSEVSEAEVEIVIDNGIDHKRVGSNWITTSNLHIWEDDNIKGSEGKITSIEPKRNCNKIVIGGKKDHEQIVLCDDKVHVFSDLRYQLAEGSISSSIEFRCDTKTSNVQTIKSDGEKQSVVHSSSSKRLISVDEFLLEETFSYPLVLNMGVTKKDNDVVFDISIVYEGYYKMQNTEGALFKEFEIQNGTSTFVISPKGNHGKGDTETKFRHIDSEGDEPKYQRRVISSNNMVILDEVNMPFPYNIPPDDY